LEEEKRGSEMDWSKFMTDLKILVSEAELLDEQLMSVNEYVAGDIEEDVIYFSFVRAYAINTIMGLVERFAADYGVELSVHIPHPEYSEDMEMEMVYDMDFLMFERFIDFFKCCRDAVRADSEVNPLYQAFSTFDPYLLERPEFEKMIESLKFKEKRLSQLTDQEKEEFLCAFKNKLIGCLDYSLAGMERCDEQHATIQAESIIQTFMECIPYAEVKDCAGPIVYCTDAAAEIENVDIIVDFYWMDFSPFFSSGVPAEIKVQMKAMLTEILNDVVCENAVEQFVFYDGDCRYASFYCAELDYEYGEVPSVSSFRISMMLIAIIGAMHVAVAAMGNPREIVNE
jgi:hypothetical protein